MNKFILALFIIYSFIVTNSNSQIGFAPYQEYLTGSFAFSIAVEDLDEDGLDDVVLTTDYTNGGMNNCKIFIYYQKDDGTLDNPIMLSYPESYTISAPSIDIGDLNGDSRKDIVISHNDSISIYYQVDPYSFNKQGIQCGNAADAVRVGDLNNDGLEDIAVTHYNGEQMVVFYQDETGNLTKVSYPSPETGFGKLEILDLNNDSLLDLAFFSTAGYEQGLYFYIQNGAGGLNLPFSYNLDVEFLRGIAFGDLNGDGLPDMAVTAGGNYPADLVLYYKKQNAWYFDPPVFLTAYDIPEPVAIYDLDCNGKNEIIIAHYAWHAISVYEQGPNGTYNDYTRFSSSYGGQSMYSMDIGDLNGDGMPDIALASGDLVINQNDTKPPVSDTLIYNEIISSDTVIYNVYLVEIQADTMASYTVIVTDSFYVHNVYNDLSFNENYFEFREGMICGHYIKDSVLIDSKYRELEILLLADTTFISRTTDTLYSGVNDNYIDGIKIYPNPGNGEFIVEYDGIYGAISLMLWDMHGRKVLGPLECRKGNHTLDLRGEPDGIYFLEMIKDGAVSRQKIILTR